MNSASQTTATSVSQADQAYSLLEEKLVSLELVPGATVKEKVLAESIGLGRTPVREAIQKLDSEGLIRVIPRKGLMLAPVLRSELVHIVEVRRVLERLLVVKAAERATPDQRRALQALAFHLQNLSGDVEAFFRLDRRLDQILGLACGNPHLIKSLSPMHAHCRRLWYLNQDQLEMGTASEFHSALARSVAEGDGASAVRALNGIVGILESLVSDLDTLT